MKIRIVSPPPAPAASGLGPAEGRHCSGMPADRPHRDLREAIARREGYIHDEQRASNNKEYPKELTNFAETIAIKVILDK